MKERLLELFNEKSYQPLTKEELILKLEFDEANIIKLEKTLDELLDEYSIFLSKKKKYMLPETLGIYKGTISIKKLEYGFITAEGFEKDFYVSGENFNGALDKDKVLFRVEGSINPDPDFKAEAEVLDVLEQNLKKVIGEVITKKGHYYLESNVEILKEIKIINTDELTKVGDIVRVEIVNYERNPLEAKIIEKIGFKNDIGIDILQIASSFNFRPKFDEATIREVNSINIDVSKELNVRRKPTLENIITIDGEDAKDLDDAVGIKKLENGNYLLGVYIADVSFYVKENGSIDVEAYDRGTSVYLVDRVIPMLPQRLSNDLCSLNPETDKLVIACEMEINQYGEVVDSTIFPSILKTKYRMTYTNVNKMLDNDQEIIEKYQDIYQNVLEMKELQVILNKMREKRGAIDFDVDEGKVIVDEKGTPIEIKLMIRGESEKVIEEFMLKANETVASTINHLELPFIYRIHDTPNVIKLNNFKDLSRSLGYQTWKKKVNSKQLQVFLEQVKEEDNYLKTFLLRSMAKAIYSESNIGHYGLGSSCYTHFTSPIRRYPDLIVHRLLRKYLFDKNINSDEFLGLTARIADIAEQSSKKERDAIDCEYQVDDMKKAEYMNSFIGEKYEGIISSVTKFGFFVSLPNTVDGLVHVSNLPGRFNFDPKTMALYGPGTKKYKLGDKVEIEVATADKKSRKIDFKVISKNEEKTVDAVKYSGNESALPTRNRGGKVSRYGESKRRRKK